MNKKLISTLSVLALLIIILVAGSIYIFIIQRGDLSARQEKLDELNKNVYDPVELDDRYQELEKRSAELDSILANREFNIPKDISSIKFYNFINNIVANFPKETTVNVEYLRQAPDKEFFFHEYKLTGGGNYNDVYKMVYAIEQSKELKKISKLSLTNLVKTDEEVPLFLVNFELVAQVYYSSDNRFAPAEYVENNLATGPIYDAFYPLIRNEIPPNVDNLLDVQGARLLALIPEGAFVADNSGNTYLVWEGEQVYLGYLTKIDYDNNTVSFILNKGGIIEQVTLELDRNLNKK
ncbi:MAG: hypothetical protein A2W30_04125 [Ignavibacteria bacterium RBG_16_36_9]|nr:MAG: hypothetical protein A2W30_04125 [Ignavibacteria bacterium RBG_16_36_9]